MNINNTLLKILSEDAGAPPVTGPTLTKPLTDPKEYTDDTTKQTPPEAHDSADETKKALGTDDAAVIAGKVKKVEVGKTSESFESILKRLEEGIVEEPKPAPVKESKTSDGEEDEEEVEESAGDDKEPVVTETVEPEEPESISDEDPEVVDGDGDEEVTEHINAIFAGTKLSEAARNKAATVFKAALATKNKKDRKKFANLASKKLQHAYGKLKESVAADRTRFETEANKRIDEAVRYTSEKWLQENKVAVEQGIRTQIAESFIAGLKKLFAEHYIEIPEAKVDVVKSLGKKVTTLESKLNEALDTNIKLRSRLDTFLKEEAIRKASSGLTDTQRDKLAKLSEDIAYNSIDEFSGKLTTLKESYFRKPGPGKEPGPLNEQTITPKPDISPEMERYTAGLNKHKNE